MPKSTRELIDQCDRFRRNFLDPQFTAPSGSANGGPQGHPPP
jgi:hypothetical protein